MNFFQTLSLSCSSKKKAIAHISLILLGSLKKSAYYLGTDSLDDSLKENCSMEWAENWPGGDCHQFR